MELQTDKERERCKSELANIWKWPQSYLDPRVGKKKSPIQTLYFSQQKTPEADNFQQTTPPLHQNEASAMKPLTLRPRGAVEGEAGKRVRMKHMYNKCDSIIIFSFSVAITSGLIMICLLRFHLYQQ